MLPAWKEQIRLTKCERMKKPEMNWFCSSLSLYPVFLFLFIFFIQGSNRSMLVSMTGFTFTNSTVRVVDSSISLVNCTFTLSEQSYVLM